jgi:hypothetical protein
MIIPFCQQGSERLAEPVEMADTNRPVARNNVDMELRITASIS